MVELWDCPISSGCGREEASIGDREVFSEPRIEKFQDGSSSQPCREVALRLGSTQSSDDAIMINFSGVGGWKPTWRG